MTAEIGILNKTAVALAADSAVTVQQPKGQKIYNSANKLFALSKYHPVGIMLFGSASFMGVPWETVIKVYRTGLKKKCFKTLKEYADDFICFVERSGSSLIPEQQQDQYVKTHVWMYFQLIKDEIKKRLEQIVNKQSPVDETKIKELAVEIVNKHFGNTEKYEFLKSVSEEKKAKFLGKYNASIDEIIQNVFEKFPFSEGDKDKLKTIAMGLFYRNGNFPKSTSGIVIAGFGDEEIFPSIYAYQFECIIDGVLKCIEEKQKSGAIDFDCEALIVPFAQSEMVHTFIEGIDPALVQFSISYLNEIFSKYPASLLEEIAIRDGIDKKALLEKLQGIGQTVLKDFIEKSQQYRQEVHISPIVNVVSILPKDELASMAEALVNLTSFKRRITMDAETVGGPIDVAVISKGDGFVWIKRKHYFKPELNPHFLKNYFREGGNNEIEQE
ncbi:MAG: hypothetical protein A4E71_02578 [Smithella sp. PtaU1.Bin162]|nr:MAG: hypothetical protein A4E71_02578 [Smithella sp. PtaU1.Bin162]